MLSCTSAFTKSGVFGSNQFLPNSALRKKFFADIVNYKMIRMVLCMFRQMRLLSRDYLRFKEKSEA